MRVFVATADAKLVCINRTSGKVRWINPLPEFRSTKKKKGEIDYTGPILAGNRLIVTGTAGTMYYFDPDSGSYQGATSVGAPVSVSPVVANNTLYVLDDAGRLHAYR